MAPTNRVPKAKMVHHRAPQGCVLVKGPASLSRCSFSFGQGNVAVLNRVIDLFDKKGSILGSTWAEANLWSA
ncbi:hypothetical protein BKA70DRAFT_1444477 [Coprinopsis sp. MPI-PUGE-AT-0042]|nr:hypothetical protein BKA70DRAFT_1444477 [Coprinopsis sp. MPI-PUGE-AT-0042]